MRGAASNANRLQRRIACIHFSKDETTALRSLLGLLDPYLKKSWDISGPEQADLVLMSIDESDAGQASSPTGKPVVACMRRPREHALPAIHRPLRASEILKVLNEFDEPAISDASSPARPLPQAAAVEAWRLDYWPLEFEKFPTSWHKVMAALAARGMTLEELIQCTHLGRAEIVQCMRKLRDIGSLRESSTSAPQIPHTTMGLRNFIAGIGRKLGLTT